MSPVLKKVLLAAVALYIAASAWMQVRLIERVASLEHDVFHLLGGKDGH